MEPSRRHLLGAGAGAAAAAAVPGTAHAAGLPRQSAAEGTDAARAVRAVQAALVRVLGAKHAAQVRPVLTGEDDDRFRVTGRNGQLRIEGRSPAVILTGLHWYLKDSGLAHLSWAGSRTSLPAGLPAPRGPLQRRATVEHRFALNDTHDGYTAPYAGWEHWEPFLDLMALHGCNELLVTAGSEAVYHRLLQEFGYGEEEARKWIPAPSHQPWWLLQNMSEYGGPVSPALLERRTRLGQRIVRRMRELGMRPVLPGWFGTVPADFTERNPDGRTVPQGGWNGMPRPAWLDPRTPVFRSAAEAFYRIQGELFGEVRHFKMDLLHEGGDPGDVPVPEAARAVERELQRARPGATWVILGWQENPRREVLQGLAEKDRMLIVDGLSDLEDITDREKDWGGVPYAFGTIPNFGGRTTLGARTHMWTERFTAWRDRAGSRLTGTAYMPEATHRDPAAFELFSELAWRREPVDRAEWFEGYARTRYGAADDGARDAFGALRESAYAIRSTDGRPHDSIFAARPSLAARSGAHYATHSPAFDLPAFDGALDGLLRVREDLRASDAYRYDVADTARQALANRSWLLIGQLESAYERQDRETFRRLSTLWLRLMRLADDVAGTHSRFLLGPWLRDARESAGGAAEEARLERTARALVTTWAGREAADTGKLANYANRDWHGLISGVHLPQWTRYLEALEDSLSSGRPPARTDWYAQEEPWTRRQDAHPLRPVADAYGTALRVRQVLEKAPYQGSLRLTVSPRALRPGGSGELSAVFRNENGLRATGRTDFALDGPPGAEPSGPTSVDRVGPGERHTVRWRVTAPGGKVEEPLRKLPCAAEVTYGPQDGDRVTARTGGELFVAGPLGPGLRTVNTNDAVFGRAGDRFAVHGGGADLWRGTAEFGAVYVPGGLRDGGSVQVRVTSQDATGPWARAGLFVCDALDGDPAGLVNLAVTPEHGVVLSWDGDGDGALDRRRQLPGVRVPVTLRLTRQGASFLAECVTDGARRTVGTARVPGAAVRQDTGIGMSAAHGGGGRRGTVAFSGWSAAPDEG